MSVELVDKKSGEVIATCTDVVRAINYMTVWGMTSAQVDVRFPDV